MYGTYWCGACRYQRKLFGEASKLVDEVECDPKGKNPQPGLCRRAGIAAYPTWEINGRMYRGVRSLTDLANLSGYEGSYDF